MNRIFSIAIALLATTVCFGQQDSSQNKPNKKKDWGLAKPLHRPNDHFMIEIGYDNWAGTNDTVRTTGLSRSFNFYFMLDIPFKTDPRFSVGAGLGIGSSNIFFNNTQVLVAAVNNSTLAFQNTGGQNHFKKFKLVTSYLEIPIELRYALNPLNTNKSWKFALGAKVGTLLSAYTKAKNLENNANQVIQAYTEKESSKKFFNGIRLVGTARISYGVFGIFGQYQITSLIKNGLGPTINPYSVGFVLSGL